MVLGLASSPRRGFQFARRYAGAGDPLRPLACGTQLPTHRGSRSGWALRSARSRGLREATRRGLIDGAVGRGTFVLPTGRESEFGSNRDGLRPLERLYLPLMQREDAINLSLNEPLPDGTGERLRKALAALTPRAASTISPTINRRRDSWRSCGGAAWLRELGVDVPATTCTPCRAGRPR